MSSAKDRQGCLTCRWADYLKTPTGRLVRGHAIHCRFPPARLNDDVARLRAALPASMRHLIVSLVPHGMDKDDGDDCPHWELNKSEGA